MQINVDEEEERSKNQALRSSNIKRLREEENPAAEIEKESLTRQKENQENIISQQTNGVNVLNRSE